MRRVAGPDRRQFLQALAMGTATAAQWLALPQSKTLAEPAGSVPTPERPRLVSGLRIIPHDGGARIERLGPKGAALVAEVNVAGKEFIEELDGTKALPELAVALQRRFGCTGASSARVESRVALFLVDLAAAGLLAEPFYVNICQTEIVHA